ncbi:hypothetical protein C7974DRAFT_445632, partial [Boeremia exigua]|uniref:uncharacterized protein n=1 Tax=Boeremia exigua TaxID=749465 RepID=UPI001E8DAAC3
MMDEHRARQMEPRCSIQDPSSELILMVMDYLPFSTQFDLACVCKRLAISSRGALERHQDSYAKYRVASDLDPSTVPLLLRSAFGQENPIAAWNVRSFEVWRDRTQWSEWQKFDLYAPMVSGQMGKPANHGVTREDVRRYLSWFEEQLGEDLELGTLEEVLNYVESGHDGLLKALLFAKLERLQDLKFITRSQEEGSCLSSLKALIAECIKSTQKKNFWPKGFCSIQNVAVGVDSGTWMTDDRDEEHCSSLFSHLLRLPSLDIICFKGLRAWSDGDSMDYNYNEEEEQCISNILTEGSSSVQHIFLHGCSGTFGEDQDIFWSAPRQLATMSIRFDGPDDFDGSTGTANVVARVQKNSLQSLMWYGYTSGWGDYPRNIVGDHCAIMDNEDFEHFETLPAMKHMSICMSDIELCMEREGIYDRFRFASRGEPDTLVVRYFATMFPPTLETLVLWDEADEHLTRLVERGLIKMMQNGRYKTLKRIFSEPMESACQGWSEGKLWFKDAIAAGMEAGVDVYTLSSNQEEMPHSIEFAEAPDKYDLHSGIYSGIRPSGWVFDPYLGRKIPLRCKAERYKALLAKHKTE